MAPADPTSLRFRDATAGDAERVAALHAASWRRHYRGAYSDSFLDGDVQSDRRQVWAARLAEPSATVTVLAEDDLGLAGFVHVMLDEDHRWGSLIDNLHVDLRRQRSGLGTVLLARAADGILACAAGPRTYLWVLGQNTAARGFYAARGGAEVEAATVPPPGGDPSRLNGSPPCLRVAWPDASVLREQLAD